MKSTTTKGADAPYSLQRQTEHTMFSSTHIFALITLLNHHALSASPIVSDAMSLYGLPAESIVVSTDERLWHELSFHQDKRTLPFSFDIETKEMSYLLPVRLDLVPDKVFFEHIKLTFDTAERRSTISFSGSF